MKNCILHAALAMGLALVFVGCMTDAERRAERINNNQAISIMPKPRNGYGSLGELAQSVKTLYIIAEHKSFCFFITEDGYMGWDRSAQFEVNGTTGYETILAIVDTPENAEIYGSGDFSRFLDYLHSQIEYAG